MTQMNIWISRYDYSTCIACPRTNDLCNQVFIHNSPALKYLQFQMRKVSQCKYKLFSSGKHTKFCIGITKFNLNILFVL